MEKLSQDDYNDTQQKETLIENTYYSELLINYLLTYILLYFPLWSAVILSELDLLRNNNGTVENYFKIVIAIIFRKKLRILAPRFVARMETLLFGWLLQRKYCLKTTRRELTIRKLPASTNLDLSAEQWKPRKNRKRKKNKYFPAGKKIKRDETLNETNPVVISDEPVPFNEESTPINQTKSDTDITDTNDPAMSLSHFAKRRRGKILWRNIMLSFTVS